MDVRFDQLNQPYYIPPPKRKVFVSYHHRADQGYCDWLTTHLGGTLEVFTDRALGDPIRSDDSEYVNRTIREDYISGSSVTVVLCGAETYKRKYVDWEICSTLHHEHALLGIALPTAMRGDQNGVIVPARLHANVQSGYAHWANWDHQAWSNAPAIFVALLEEAIRRSTNKQLIQNNMEKMARNQS